MHIAIFNGATGSRKCLPQNLATKYLRASYILTLASENILFDAFKVKQLNQPINCGIQGIWITHNYPRWKKDTVSTTHAGLDSSSISTVVSPTNRAAPERSLTDLMTDRARILLSTATILGKRTLFKP